LPGAQGVLAGIRSRKGLAVCGILSLAISGDFYNKLKNNDNLYDQQCLGLEVVNIFRV
jgi:hypothetical protein